MRLAAGSYVQWESLQGRCLMTWRPKMRKRKIDLPRFISAKKATSRKWQHICGVSMIFFSLQLQFVCGSFSGLFPFSLIYISDCQLKQVTQSRRGTCHVHVCSCNLQSRRVKHAPERCSVFISIDTGGTGRDLMRAETFCISHVHSGVYADVARWWNPSVLESVFPSRGQENKSAEAPFPSAVTRSLPQILLFLFCLYVYRCLPHASNSITNGPVIALAPPGSSRFLFQPESSPRWQFLMWFYQWQIHV